MQILEQFDRKKRSVRDYGTSRSLPMKNDLRDVERRAFDEFAPPLAHSSSSPNLGSPSMASASVQTHAGGHSPSSMTTIPVKSLSRLSSSPSLQRTLQRGFGGTASRPDIHPRAWSELGPGAYDTHIVGTQTWEKDHVSHPAQKQLSNHKSVVVSSFGRPKPLAVPSGPPLSRLPGPGHYMMPNYWDPNWQHNPTFGKSFHRPNPSRFGNLGRGLSKTDTNDSGDKNEKDDKGDKKGDASNKETIEFFKRSGLHLSVFNN